MDKFRQTAAWRIAKGAFFDPVRRVVANAVRGDRVPLFWCEGANWGDALSPVLVERLSGAAVVPAHGLHLDRFLVVGSILGSANERAEVWGSGFIREGETVEGPPKAVHAIRGPLSRKALLSQGIDCPEIYGDPALLLPMFMDPNVEKRYSVGVIPHYIDKQQSCIRECLADPAIIIIDIESGLEEFVRAVKSCDLILSSSLHGLICADAYGIPRAWVRFSDAVEGRGFKFQDYGLAIGEAAPSATDISGLGDVYAAARSAKLVSVSIDRSQLLLSCPFLSDELRLQALKI